MICTRGRCAGRDPRLVFRFFFGASSIGAVLSCSAASADGARESAQDWRDLLLDLKRRGLDVPPRLAIAHGALGFWKAAGEVWPKTREQHRRSIEPPDRQTHPELPQLAK